MGRTSDAPRRSTGSKRGETSSRKSTSKSTNPTSPTRAQILAQNRPLVQNRQIIFGRPVHTQYLTPYQVEEVFTNLNLEEFLKLNHDVFPNHVREFYAGFSFNGIHYITLHMYNKTWEMTLHTFGEYLDIPSEGLQFYSDTHDISILSSIDIDPETVVRTICHPDVSPRTTRLLANQLLPECQVWTKVIHHNIYVKGGNQQDIQASVAFLLYCLKTNTAVDMAYFMASRMNGLPNSRRALPYGSMLSKLFQFLDLPRAPRVGNDSLPIDHQSLVKIKLIGRSSSKRVRREESVEEEESSDEDQHDEEASTHRRSHVSRAEFDSLHQAVENNTRRVQENTTLLEKIFAFIQAKMSCKCTDSVNASQPRRSHSA